MAAKTTYSVTLPDGTVTTRKSARDYTFAVAVLSGTMPDDAKWSVYSFNGRFDLAAKQANQLRNTIGQIWISGHVDYDVKVLEVTKA